MRQYGSYDVVVVGGGASGATAAIYAARNGAKTILIETLGSIGGMVNLVGPPGWAFSHLWNEAGEKIIGGFVDELYNDLRKMDCAQPMPEKGFNGNATAAFIDIDWAGLLLFEKCREAGVELMLHTIAVDVVKEDNVIKGVIVENTSGRMSVMGKVIIEATGEGDIMARAGVQYSQIDRNVEELDPPSITFHMDGVDWSKVTAYFKAHPDQFLPGYIKGRELEDFEKERYEYRLKRLAECESVIDLVREGLVETFDYDELSHQALENGDMHPYGDLGHYFTYRQGGHYQPVFQHTAQAVDCDTTDITEYSWGEMETRRQVVIAVPAIKKYLPGFENAYVTRMTAGMRTREGRHTVGDYQMVYTDVRDAAKYDDCVAKCSMAVTRGGPFHSAKTPGIAMNVDPTREHFQPANRGSYDIRYKCFVPKGIEGMLLTGKLVSVTEDFKRDLLPDNIIWGQAAGTAAAICVKKGITPRQLEECVSELQDQLRKDGAILDGVK